MIEALVTNIAVGTIITSLLIYLIHKLDRVEKRVTRIETYLCYKNANYREVVKTLEKE